MITAKITQKEKRADGRIRVLVNISNGAEVVEKEYYPSSLEDLNFLVRKDVDAYKNRDAIFPDFVEGDLDFSKKQTPPTPPTQDLIDLNTFLKDYARLTRIKKLIDLGILTGSENQVTSLLSKIKSEFKPEYIEEV